MSNLSQSAVCVRAETAIDFEAIRRVNTEAFSRPAEANLVDVLRRHRQIFLSLVAEVEKEIVGHAVLTQVMLLPAVPGLRMLGLGPVAVLPHFQRQGIGSALVRHAIGLNRDEDCQAMVVVGDPEFYARFDFVPASQFGLRCEFRAPDDAFRVLELQPQTLRGLRGIVRFQPEFSGF